MMGDIEKLIRFQLWCLDDTIPPLDCKEFLKGGYVDFSHLTELKNQRTEGPESRTDGETLIFWD